MSIEIKEPGDCLCKIHPNSAASVVVVIENTPNPICSVCEEELFNKMMKRRHIVGKFTRLKKTLMELWEDTTVKNDFSLLEQRTVVKSIEWTSEGIIVGTENMSYSIEKLMDIRVSSNLDGRSIFTLEGTDEEMIIILVKRGRASL
jgi:hypothetical protein